MSLPLPMASVIADCNLGPLTIERSGPPAKNAFGGMTPATPTNVVFDPIMWHTVTGRDLLQVPEADRAGEVREFYSVARLYVATDGQAPDVILQGGRRWRCIKAHSYDPQGGVYITFAVLEDPQNTP